MRYRVIHDFTDLRDGRHIYRVGDAYPRKGKVTKKRIEELSGTDNRIGVPLIEEVEEEADDGDDDRDDVQ